MLTTTMVMHVVIRLAPRWRHRAWRWRVLTTTLGSHVLRWSHIRLRSHGRTYNTQDRAILSRGTLRVVVAL